MELGFLQVAALPVIQPKVSKHQSMMIKHK